MRHRKKYQHSDQKTAHTAKMAQNDKYATFENRVNDRAKKEFHRPAYGVSDYMKKLGVDIKKGVGAGGQTDAAAVQITTKGDTKNTKEAGQAV